MNKIFSEQELDNFIDSLNQEREPHVSDHQDTAELQTVARLVKNLRPNSGPQPGFTEGLYRNISKQTRARRTVIPWVGLVASIRKTRGRFFCLAEDLTC